jgi:hypothetical protein
MALINTIHGPMDESLLLVHRTTPTHGDGVYELVIVECCLKGCPGQAHRTKIADAPEVFCRLNISRKVDVKMTRWPEGMGITTGF